MNYITYDNINIVAILYSDIMEYGFIILRYKMSDNKYILGQLL